MKSADKRSGYQSEDDNIRYKLNHKFLNQTNTKVPAKSNLKKRESLKIEIKKGNSVKHEIKKQTTGSNDEENILYSFPTVLSNHKSVDKKPKQKIKVNFWSSKFSGTRLHDKKSLNGPSNRRHTVGVPSKDLKTKASAVKVRKRVSFLPAPLFSDNHVPMVTVPDDLTIQLNEEEANDLSEDLNEGFVNDEPTKRKARSSMTQTSPTTSTKRRLEPPTSRHGNENELEFFSKYVVQKLRKMETNQRIYSENLINTVLMLGQLKKLTGKSKINEA